MSSADLPERMFVIAWAFRVKPEHRREFERAYGPAGDWVRLFRTAAGYVRTELHREPENPSRYITLDFWRNRQQYESFKQEASAAYHQIDAKCESLTEDERLLGEFETLSLLRADLPKLGSSTRVHLSFTTRNAVPADIPLILNVEQRASSAAHWSENAYAAIFATNAPPRLTIVAENEERRLCGFLVARLAADECELENIVVVPQQKRSGVGSALLQHLISALSERGIRRIFLEVRESNDPARQLYKRFGFAESSFRRGYYRDPRENAVLYSLELGSTSHQPLATACELP